MTVLFFVLGAMTGGFIGVCAMCLFTVSGAESRQEEKHDEAIKN